MNKLAKAILEEYYEGDLDMKDLQEASFKYADMGNCYSYVEATGYVGGDYKTGEYVSKQIRVEELFIFLGNKLF